MSAASPGCAIESGLAKIAVVIARSHTNHLAILL